MSKLTIHAALPVYNGERYIAEALQSVFDQVRQPDTLYVIDDGSTDGTVDVVREILAQHENVDSQLISQANGGRSAALNRAFDELSDGIVVFIDADDLWLPDHLAQIERAFQETPGLVVAFGDAEGFDASGLVVKASYLKESRLDTCGYSTQPGSGFRVLDDTLTSALLPGSFIANCSSAVLVREAKSTGGFDPRFPLVEDRDFWLRMSKRGRWGYFPQIHSRVRYHDANATGAQNKLNVKRCRAVLSQALVAGREGVDLNDAEHDLAVAVLRETLAAYRFEASIHGFGAYMRSFALHGTCRARWDFALDIRSFVRAIVHGN